MDISIISMVLTAVLVLSCLFLVLAPLFKWEAYAKFSTGAQDSTADKEALYTTLNEIEFEHKMGKVSDSDYKSLRKQYESEISNIMKTDEKKPKKTVDMDILADVEREIEATINKKYKKEGDR
jgi:Skp family chaperone for outer membrane proteins